MMIEIWKYIYLHTSRINYWNRRMTSKTHILCYNNAFYLTDYFCLTNFVLYFLVLQQLISYQLKQHDLKLTSLGVMKRNTRIDAKPFIYETLWKLVLIKTINSVINTENPIKYEMNRYFTSFITDNWWIACIQKYP